MRAHLGIASHLTQVISPRSPSTASGAHVRPRQIRGAELLDPLARLVVLSSGFSSSSLLLSSLELSDTKVYAPQTRVCVLAMTNRFKAASAGETELLFV